MRPLGYIMTDGLNWFAKYWVPAGGYTPRHFWELNTDDTTGTSEGWLDITDHPHAKFLSAFADTQHGHLPGTWSYDQGLAEEFTSNPREIIRGVVA